MPSVGHAAAADHVVQRWRLAADQSASSAQTKQVLNSTYLFIV